ncbi:MAG: peptidoglycan DD-metalloendopeptidase family protein [bacterium]
MNKTQIRRFVSKGAVYLLLISFVVIPFSLKAEDVDEEELSKQIQNINLQIGKKRQAIDNLKESEEELQKQVSAYQNEAASLQAQISILDSEISQTESNIEKTKVEIEKIGLEVESINLEITEQENRIEEQKEVLSELLRILYQQSQKDPLEIFLGYDSLSQVYDQEHYMATLESQGKKALDEIESIRRELKWQNTVLAAKKEKQQNLQAELERNKEILNEELSGKDRLLTETNNEEAKYQTLLEQAKAERDAAEAQVSSMESQVNSILEQARQKNLFDGWTPTAGTTGVLNWPVVPTRGISAYFHDEAYRSYFGVDHYAIDIPTPQGTPIHAPADAIVGRTYDAGYGYSFIVLIHNEQLTTVYGHISSFAVSEGQFVTSGSVIGYSGGTPGTRGAGWRTTGAHLHFEVRINGIPNDPLNYLPSF